VQYAATSGASMPLCGIKNLIFCKTESFVKTLFWCNDAGKVKKYIQYKSAN
jgi:hypothetical protein